VLTLAAGRFRPGPLARPDRASGRDGPADLLPARAAGRDGGGQNAAVAWARRRLA